LADFRQSLKLVDTVDGGAKGRKKNRIDQYNLLLYTIENNIKKKWELLPEIIPNYSPSFF